MSTPHPYRDDAGGWPAHAPQGAAPAPATQPLDFLGAGNYRTAAAPEPAGYAPAQYPAPPATPYPAPPPTAAFPTPYQPSVVQAGQGRPYQGMSAAPDHPNSTAALVLGILGFTLMFIGLPLAGPFAWWLGAKGRRDMRREPGRYGPSTGLTVGWVLGIISSIVLMLMTLLVLALFLWITASIRRY